MALWDDIEVPENMNSCIYNAVSFEEFWRGWHTGLNMWLIRYIYIPLGGKKNLTIAVFTTFTFVAFWHE